MCSRFFAVLASGTRCSINLGNVPVGSTQRVVLRDAAVVFVAERRAPERGLYVEIADIEREYEIVNASFSFTAKR